MVDPVDRSIYAILARAHVMRRNSEHHQPIGHFKSPTEQKLFDEGCDVLKLWREALEGTTWRPYRLPTLLRGEFNQRKRLRWYRKAAKYAVEAGLDSMLEAYYSGVPVEDIIA